MEQASPPKSKAIAACLFILLAAAALCSYSNHFENGFHFDDVHAVENNPFIRDLSFIPRFFSDPKTFSSSPTHYGFRPLVTTTLAIDYHFANGLFPFNFHLSTFCWFLLQLILMLLLFSRLEQKTASSAYPLWFGFFAVLFYGLHPANADTINYVVQRGEVFVTTLFLLSFCLYEFSAFARKSYLFAAPLLVAFLAKQTSAVFAAVFLAYILLFELDGSFLIWRSWSKFLIALKKSLPLFILAVAYYLFQARMQANWDSQVSVFNYSISQPYVILLYLKNFLLPDSLNVDPDLAPLNSLLDLRFVVGSLALISVIILAARFSISSRTKPIAFGLAWFFLTLLPSSSIFTLSEIMNSHRTYLPFVGLALALCSAIGILHEKLATKFSRETALLLLGCALICIYTPYGVATFERNKVWLTEESFWHDVVQKSPHNARAQMNYGQSLLNRAAYKEALSAFQRGVELKPTYSLLYTNMAIAYDGLNEQSLAEQNFRIAINVADQKEVPRFYYARWLETQGRDGEAIELLKVNLWVNPLDFESRRMLLLLLLASGKIGDYDKFAAETEKLFPNLPLPILSDKDSDLALLADSQKLIVATLLHYNNKAFQTCVEVAERALKLNPDIAGLQNNLAACFMALEKFKEAIPHADKAYELDPSLEIARNNAAYSRQKLAEQK